LLCVPGGTSGALYPQSATAGLNSLSRSGIVGLRLLRGVDDQRAAVVPNRRSRLGTLRPCMESALPAFPARSRRRTPRQVESRGISRRCKRRRVGFPQVGNTLWKTAPDLWFAQRRKAPRVRVDRSLSRGAGRTQPSCGRRLVRRPPVSSREPWFLFRDPCSETPTGRDTSARHEVSGSDCLGAKLRATCSCGGTGETFGFSAVPDTGRLDLTCAARREAACSNAVLGATPGKACRDSGRCVAVLGNRVDCRSRQAVSGVSNTSEARQRAFDAVRRAVPGANREGLFRMPEADSRWQNR
jgi:hypothetical protein